MPSNSVRDLLIEAQEELIKLYLKKLKDGTITAAEQRELNALLSRNGILVTAASEATTDLLDALEDPAIRSQLEDLEPPPSNFYT